MRASEFIDFLNSESLRGVELYSHLEVREKNKDGKMALKVNYRQARREYRERIKNIINKEENNK